MFGCEIIIFFQNWPLCIVGQMEIMHVFEWFRCDQYFGFHNDGKYKKRLQNLEYISKTKKIKKNTIGTHR